MRGKIMKMMTEPEMEGVLGLAVSGVLWSIATWRLVFHMSHCGVTTATTSSTASPSVASCFTPRRVFHFLLWMAMTVEAIAYADLSQWFPLSSNRHEAETWRFVLGTLVGRSTFELLAFCTVTFLWLQMALEARSVSFPNKNYYLEACLWILVVANVVVVFTAMWEAVFLVWFSTDDSNTDTKDDSRDHIEDSFQQYTVFELQELLEGVAWGIHAVIVTVCMALTYKQIHQNLTTFSAPTGRRMTIWVKALLPMAVCASCYLVRSLFLIAQVCFSLHQPEHPTEITTKKRLVWWIVEEGPTWIAATMLLYSARKPDRFLSRLSQSPLDQSYTPSGGRMREPLLSTPVPPPAEVFLSFRQWNQVDSQFFLSPNMLADDDDGDDGRDDYNVGEGNDAVLVEPQNIVANYEAEHNDEHV